MVASVKVEPTVALEENAAGMTLVATTPEPTVAEELIPAGTTALVATTAAVTDAAELMPAG